MKIEEIDLKKDLSVLESLNKILDCTTAISETIRIIKRDKTIYKKLGTSSESRYGKGKRVTRAV